MTGDGTSVSYALIRVRPGPRPVIRLSLNQFARQAGLHPDLVRRLVVLGVVDAARDAAGDLTFGSDQLPAVARLQRLRAGFGLNYAALGLVADLLDRIAALETALRQQPAHR
ncbi:MAG TPA: chaperone modulator CbpM [Streptosporangiaceae bacterium]